MTAPIVDDEDDEDIDWTCCHPMYPCPDHDYDYWMDRREDDM